MVVQIVNALVAKNRFSRNVLSGSVSSLLRGFSVHMSIVKPSC